MNFILWICVCVICFLMYYHLRYPFVKMMNKLPGPIGGPVFGFIFIGLLTPRHSK